MYYNYMAKQKNNRGWAIVAILGIGIILYFIGLVNYWVTPRLLMP